MLENIHIYIYMGCICDNLRQTFLRDLLHHLEGLKIPEVQEQPSNIVSLNLVWTLLYSLFIDDPNSAPNNSFAVLGGGSLEPEIIWVKRVTQYSITRELVG